MNLNNIKTTKTNKVLVPLAASREMIPLDSGIRASGVASEGPADQTEYVLFLIDTALPTQIILSIINFYSTSKNVILNQRMLRGCRVHKGS